MFRNWFVAHRSLILTVVGGAVIAALVAAFAITSTGYTAQQLNLNDSSVWVANGTQQAIGRANTTVRQLNSVVSTTGNDLDVLQNSSTVMLVDNADSKLQIVDPTTSTVTQTVPLPPNQPQVFLSKTAVVIVATTTGQVWITPLQQIATFSTQSSTPLSFGPNVVASMDSNGILFVYSPSAKKVSRLEPDASQAVVGTDNLSLPVKNTFQITSVDGQWAVLDATTSRVYVAGANVSLGGTVAASSPAIQQPSATGERILVAGSAGVVALSLGASTPATLVRGETGVATRPLSVGGCDYAAWTDGHAWRACSSDGPTGTTMPLSGTSAGMKLALRSNGSRVVLNDSRSGATWAV
ncbi:MAG: large repetitive protein, partial [Actinomycetota bacterium]|nr:large repetitive protein [Actinomycetota bacterium]